MRFKEGEGVKIHSMRISKTLWLNTINIVSCNANDSQIQFQSFRRLRKKDIELKITV